MTKLKIEDLENKNLLMYKYIRGSKLYNLNLPTSDDDVGGIYIAPIEQLLGLGFSYQEQVSDERNDTTYYEIRKWIQMLLKSNPTAMESLYIPEDKIIGNVHPFIQNILDNRDLFLTKEIFAPMVGYAHTQIQKARGLNKKVTKPMVIRKELLDFAYTPYKQGSTEILKWLEYRGLNQKYCGLVHIPNMRDGHGVYYDFGNHILSEGITFQQLKDIAFYDENLIPELDKLINFYMEFKGCSNFEAPKGLMDEQPIGYKGMVAEDGSSNELRLSSVSKGEVPICIMTYNKDAYTSHCKDYKEYKAWEKDRNQIRYQATVDAGKGYDQKNMMHCVRLMHMAHEMATNQGFNIVRTWDREMLLDIRHGNREYEDLIAYADDLKEKIVEAIPTCSLPESPNVSDIDQLLIDIRKQQL